MILRHLIEKLENTGRQFSSADIPVVDEKEEDLDFDIEIIQDKEGNYRIQMIRIWG